jgi:hypothetical protein
VLPRKPSKNTKVTLTPDQSMPAIPDIPQIEQARAEMKVATPEQVALRTGSQERIAKLQEGIPTGGEPKVVTGDPGDAARAAAVRPVKAKRQDVLAQAPRTADGMLDWDKLDQAQRKAVAGMLGTSYREKVLPMSLKQMQAVLSDGQFQSVVKALSRQPRAEAPAATPEATATTPETPAAPVQTVAPGKVLPRKPGASLPLEQVSAEKAPEPAPVDAPAPAVAEPAINPAAAPTVDTKKVSPGWWDSSHATHEQMVALIKAVAAKRQIPLDAEIAAKTPFDQLPPALRRGLPQEDAPALPTAEGGAGSAPATFRGKRKGPKQ